MNLYQDISTDTHYSGRVLLWDPGHFIESYKSPAPLLEGKKAEVYVILSVIRHAYLPTTFLRWTIKHNHCLMCETVIKTSYNDSNLLGTAWRGECLLHCSSRLTGEEKEPDSPAWSVERPFWGLLLQGPVLWLKFGDGYLVTL